MIKKILTMTLVAAIAVSVCLTGCGKGDREKMDEYRNLGISQMQIGDYTKAAESFQSALDQSYGRVGAEELDLCYYKALAQYQAGKYKTAVETYTGLISYDETNWEVYYLRGNANLAAKQLKEALEDYDKAVELNPDDFQLYAHIDENLSAFGHEDKGDEYLNQALSLAIKTPEDYAGAGQIYYRKGDMTNAETCLIQAKDDGYDDAMLLLGCVYMDEKKIEDALNTFDGYALMYKDNCDALYNLAKMAMQAGCNDNALDYLVQAYELAETAATKQQIQKSLIAAYEYTGNYGAAYDTAAAYLQDFPEDSNMQRELVFLQTRSDGTQLESEEEKAAREAEEARKQEEAEREAKAKEAEEAAGGPIEGTVEDASGVQ